MLASFRMDFRLLLVTLALCGGGCFDDPPSSGSGGSASSGMLDDTSSSTTDAVGSTSVESTTSGVETGIADGSSSSGASCELIGAEVPTVPADVVVLIGPNVDGDAVSRALDEFIATPSNNLAIIAPDNALADIDLEVDCLQGCGGTCGENPNRIILPYDPADSPYATLASFSDFDCIFREPLPDTSGPVSNLWFITAEPMQMPPKQLAAFVLEGTQPLRVHVSCPECNDDLFNANSLLKEVVVASGGTVSDSNELGSIVAQVDRIGALRDSCAWATDSGTDLVVLTLMGGETLFVERAKSFAECEFDTILDRGIGLFFETDSGVRLCPNSCQQLQSLPENFVEIDECI